MSVAFRPTISLNEDPSRMNIFWQTCVNVSHVSQVQPISPDPFTNETAQVGFLLQTCLTIAAMSVSPFKLIHKNHVLYIL